MKNFFKHHRAETILEVIIAVAVLMVILAPASALYISSTHTIAGNRNDLIAASLAEEGIEMVRNFRDTNFLKFSPKAQECWNTKIKKDDSSDIALVDCDSEKIATGRFRLILDPNTLEWNLEAPSDPTSQLSEPLLSIPAAGNIEEYRLRSDIPTQTNPECTGGPGVPADCSVHTSLYFAAPDAGFANRGEASLFYRQIMVEYPLASEMKVTSLVQYRRGNNIRNIKRIDRFSNQFSE